MRNVRKLRAYRKTVSIVKETTIGLYESLAGKNTGFLLESYDKNNGRYSIFGTKPEEIISSKGQSLVIERKDGTKEVREGNPYIKLREYFQEFNVTKEDGELAFSGGFLGSLGYDFIRYTEDIPDENEDEIGIETIQLMFAKEFIVIDHMAETMSGVVLEEETEEGKQRAVKRAGELLETALSGYDEALTEYDEELSRDGRIVKKSDTLQEYSEKVDKIKDYIKEGHIFQTVLSQRWTVKTKQDGFTLYKGLRKVNPSP